MIKLSLINEKFGAKVSDTVCGWFIKGVRDVRGSRTFLGVGCVLVDRS
jgi:hypothetical protein